MTTIDRNNFFKKGVIGNVRKAQEDSCDFAPMTENGDIFVVCDGMGGHVGGAKASSLAVESILSYMKKEKYANPVEALNGALQFANMQILGYANDNPDFRGMGTTACIVLMQGDDVWVAHAGDSRIYLYLGKERQLHRITKDHSYVQGLVDSGEITDEMAEHHPMKNRITKALGIRPELTPTITPLNQPIHPKDGDIFLICTDGLSGMITDRTIAGVLAENTPLEQRGEKLIALAMEGEIVQPGGQDNCTLELIRVEGSPWKSSQFVSYNPRPTNEPRGNNRSGAKRLWMKSPITYAAIAVVAILVIVFCVVFPKHNKAKKIAELQKAYNSAMIAYETAQTTFEADSAKFVKDIVKDSLNVLTWKDEVVKAEKDKPSKPTQADMKKYADRLTDVKTNYEQANRTFDNAKAQYAKSKADRDAKYAAMIATKKQLEQLQGEKVGEGGQAKSKVSGTAKEHADVLQRSTSTQNAAPTTNTNTQKVTAGSKKNVTNSKKETQKNTKDPIKEVKKQAEKVIAHEDDVTPDKNQGAKTGEGKQ